MSQHTFESDGLQITYEATGRAYRATFDDPAEDRDIELVSVVSTVVHKGEEVEIDLLEHVRAGAGLEQLEQWAQSEAEEHDAEHALQYQAEEEWA